MPDRDLVERLEGAGLTPDQDEWLRKRIVQLKSRAASVGPFRAAGIHRTIAGMKAQLRSKTWAPHASARQPENTGGEG